MPLLCAIAIVRPEMKVIRGDSSVLLPGSSLHSARASKNYNLILFRTILHPPDSFVSKNEGMAEGVNSRIVGVSWGPMKTMSGLSVRFVQHYKNHVPRIVISRNQRPPRRRGVHWPGAVLPCESSRRQEAQSDARKTRHLAVGQAADTPRPGGLRRPPSRSHGAALASRPRAPPAFAA